MNIGHERSERLRELIARPRGVCTLGARDAWAATLLQIKGYSSIYLGGYGAATARGQRDQKIYPSDYMISLARVVARAVDVPVMVDMDEGGAGVHDTRENFELALETTRAAGVHWEDQILPKRCGQLMGKAVFDFEMAVPRMRCAIDAVREVRKEAVFMARTDAFVAAGHHHDEKAGGDIDEVVKRGLAYADAGADIVWCEFPRTDLRHAFETFAEEMHKTGRHPQLPLGFNISPSNLWGATSVTRDELNQWGYRYLFCTYGLLLAEAFSGGAWSFADDFRSNPTFALAGLQERLRHVSGLEKYEPNNIVNKLLGITEATALELRYDPSAEARFATSEGHR